jgi:hypothetical protein
LGLAAAFLLLGLFSSLGSIIAMRRHTAVSVGVTSASTFASTRVRKVIDEWIDRRFIGNRSADWRSFAADGDSSLG